VLTVTQLKTAKKVLNSAVFQSIVQVFCVVYVTSLCSPTLRWPFHVHSWWNGI